MKEPLGFFINHVFVVVFQYDSGTPKHALELKKTFNFFWILHKRTELYGLELKVQKVKFKVLNSFQWFFFHFFHFFLKCKIRFRTYCIHRNIKICTYDLNCPRDYWGGGGGGGARPLIGKRLLKKSKFLRHPPLPKAQNFPEFFLQIVGIPRHDNCHIGPI